MNGPSELVTANLALHPATLPADALILHGNNHDSNRGCQALRWCTQMILDRWAPNLVRLHANVFYNDHPHFLGARRIGIPPVNCGRSTDAARWATISGERVLSVRVSWAGFPPCECTGS